MKYLITVAIASFFMGFFIALAMYDNPPVYNQSKTTRIAMYKERVLPYDDPFLPFKATNKKYPDVRVVWQTAKDVHRECNKSRVALGLHTFNNDELACSIFSGDECTIITSRYPTMHSVGHEIRHCFFGNWHEKLD